MLTLKRIERLSYPRTQFHLVVYDWDGLPVGAPRPESGGLGSWFSIGLDVVGLVPIVGDAVDGIRCGVETIGGNATADTALTCAAMIPGAGWVAFTAKTGRRIGDAASATRGATGVKTALRACTANSFTPNTRVLMADGKTKRIEDVEVGDLVWAEDPATGRAGSRRVTHTIAGSGVKRLIDIEVDGEIVTATDGHPFWVDDECRWIKADELQPGNRLALANGTTVDVDAVADRAAVLTVHNLTVGGIHTYYVMAGDAPVLVHNCNLTSKIRSQMAARGWTEDLVRDVRANPDFTHQVWDLGADAPATAYARSYNEYVIINDLTGDVIQISDRADLFWKPSWNDPKFAPRR